MRTVGVRPQTVANVRARPSDGVCQVKALVTDRKPTQFKNFIVSDPIEAAVSNAKGLTQVLSKPFGYQLEPLHVSRAQGARRHLGDFADALNVPLGHVLYAKNIPGIGVIRMRNCLKLSVLKNTVLHKEVRRGAEHCPPQWEGVAPRIK